MTIPIPKFIDAHLKYAKYVLVHKLYVMVECGRVDKYYKGRGGVGKWQMVWRGLTHDLSKLLPSEWTPYVNYFYGDSSKKGVKAKFDKAWLFHQKRNPHHWQYWMLREDDGKTKLLKMPEQYVKEMVCDWVGAGRAITGKIEVRDWYEKNEDRIQLHPATRVEVEKVLRGCTNYHTILELRREK